MPPHGDITRCKACGRDYPASEINKDGLCKLCVEQQAAAQEHIEGSDTEEQEGE